MVCRRTIFKVWKKLIEQFCNVNDRKVWNPIPMRSLKTETVHVHDIHSPHQHLCHMFLYLFIFMDSRTTYFFSHTFVSLMSRNFVYHYCFVLQKPFGSSCRSLKCFGLVQVNTLRSSICSITFFVLHILFSILFSPCISICSFAPVMSLLNSFSLFGRRLDTYTSLLSSPSSYPPYPSFLRTKLSRGLSSFPTLLLPLAEELECTRPYFVRLGSFIPHPFFTNENMTPEPISHLLTSDIPINLWLWEKIFAVSLYFTYIYRSQNLLPLLSTLAAR